MGVEPPRPRRLESALAVARACARSPVVYVFLDAPRGGRPGKSDHGGDREARGHHAPDPFHIHVEEAVLADLQLRLRDTRWARASPDDGWKRGTSAGYLRDLVTYWSQQYDWRCHEGALNRLPQFKADVGGARLHFVRHSKAARQPPLLLLHGWPDSFYRFHKVIPTLAEAFEVVVPSLPGFGFTGVVRHPTPEQPNRQSAALLWRLMTEVLGHRRFAVAGGDGGSALAQLIAIDHPESVVGIHLTDLGWHVAGADRSKLSRAERKYLDAGQKRFMTDGAYAMVQSTRPQSLAPALNDSPVALASWILDRFHAWSKSFEDGFTKDELLTNIMIYWVTQTIGSSMANYRAEAVSPSLSVADRVDVPVALALFPHDIGGIPPRVFAERTLNVQRWTEMPRGGHFAAWEEPELYARDVAAFFTTCFGGLASGH
jgi:pimeloyl-ACP methyl ester carboxylesterase